MIERYDEIKIQLEKIIDKDIELFNAMEILYIKIPEDLKVINNCQNLEKKYERALELWYEQGKLKEMYNERKQNYLLGKELKNEIEKVIAVYKDEYYLKIVKLIKKIENIEGNLGELKIIEDIREQTVGVVFHTLGDFLIKEIEIQKQNFKNQNNELTEQRKKIEDHDKNILNIMGIFLAIFSLIGFNISFLPEIPDYFGGWQIIGFAILINILIVTSISALFLLIKFITKK